MKPRLVILSDLWGKGKSEWVKTYEEILKHDYEIRFYDCCELGELEISDYSEIKLHEQFVNGGIETAAQKLVYLEKGKIDVMAFSIGGTIAWSAALKGLDIGNMLAISSTRLRYETEVPNCEIMLYFGEKDNNNPNEAWLKKNETICEVVNGKRHDMYYESNFARKVCDVILSKRKDRL